MYKKWTGNVRGLHGGVRKFIPKIQKTFPNCADINLCRILMYCARVHSYLLMHYVCIYTYFQAKLNLKSSNIIIHMSDPNTKSSNILSDGL
jgi:hypothetical protein